jgi:sulfate/thiosulfate transport system permease protein
VSTLLEDRPATTPADPRAPRMSAGSRRTLVHGGFIAIAVLYVGILVIAPLVAIAWQAFKPGLKVIVDTLTSPDVLHAFSLTAVITIVTVVVTSVFGVIVALVITRDSFPGKALVSAFVDLPIAVSPVIVGVMAIVLFGRGGWLEPWFAARGIEILYAVPSMVLVTIFICIPFVVREVAPVLDELGVSEEEASRTLGASSLQTFFRVTLKNIRWALLYGIALSTARSIGEIGAVAIVSGNITGRTETATIYIMRQFDQFNDAEGYIVAMALALVSIVILVAIETFKRRQQKDRET